MRRAQNGAALAITLVLLAGLGALAMTAAAAAISALALTDHQQAAQQAFEAAEAGVAISLVHAALTRSPGIIPATPYPDGADAQATYESRIESTDLPGALPAGFSVGEHDSAFAARHYFVVSDGSAARGTRVRIEQGFYLVVPGPGS